MTTATAFRGTVQGSEDLVRSLDRYRHDPAMLRPLQNQWALERGRAGRTAGTKFRTCLVRWLMSSASSPRRSPEKRSSPGARRR
ncbi:hypothetical protein [Streptomyces sp. NPDC101234]|uniref:hypothetical protein n=1 Tax=Streptomyces sp. NPDC101234 TaxID=3366138 RepID=UPI0038144698